MTPQLRFFFFSRCRIIGLTPSPFAIVLPYISNYPQEETHAEVKVLSVVQERPLISLSIGRSFKNCSKDIKLGDRDHDASGIVEFQKTRFPEFDMRRMERDVGVQAAQEGVGCGTQTTWNRPLNKITQYEVNSTGTGTGTGSAIDGGDERSMDFDSVATMLKNTIEYVEAALQQNETVNIFTEAMAIVGEDDGAISSKMENQLKELRNFTDLDFSKGKVRSQRAHDQPLFSFPFVSFILCPYSYSSNQPNCSPSSLL